jgi:small subunit ribosomal protein S3
LVLNIYSGRPAVLIGQKGANIEVIKKQLSKVISPVKNLVINIKEIKKPDLDATLVAEGIVAQLEKRVAYKRALKQALQKVMKAGAKGCKVRVSGVVNGANTIGTSETYMEGSLPLQTIRADVDYAVTAAYTNYGKLGVKVWIYKGDILEKKSQNDKGGQD